jgi:hypothetical protein
MTTTASRAAGFRAARSRASVAASSAEKQSSNRYRRGRFTSARAIDSRCRWPPETLVPPWSMGASSWPGMAATKSAAWAMSRACHSSVSVASGRPSRRLLATVPLNRNAACGTSPMSCQSGSSSCSRTSTPLTRTLPSVGSESRGMRLSSVVLPLPVPPMIALTWPGRRVNDRSLSTGCSLRGYPKLTFRNSTRPVTAAGRTGAGR